MKQLISLIAWFLLALSTLCAQTDVQWASEIIGVSSEFKYDKYPGQYLRQQVLGAPSSMPVPTDG
jgi:hypothetical protein